MKSEGKVIFLKISKQSSYWVSICDNVKIGVGMLNTLFTEEYKFNMQVKIM